MKPKKTKTPKIKKGLAKCVICSLLFPLILAHVTLKGILCNNCVCK